ncbi:1304_t:CDS:2 [Entrophospora sp. SA101]|nr:1304_t:CDS:2 [Entrophospora sp. SA101]
MTTYDLIIIGAGPAGLTAAVYARRALLKTLICEKAIAGGKLNKTADVDNYPGFTSEEVIKLEKKEKEFIVKTNEGNTIASRTVIIASEAVVVVGGGYSALETALYLTNIATKVYLVHRRDSFRTEKEISDKVINNPKIILILNSQLLAIEGREEKERKVVEKVIIKINNQKKELLVRAVFPCVGLLPFSNFVHELSICDRQDYITIKDDCSTMVPGLFAAGDVARANQNKIKQIVTAVAEGAIAAQSVIKYLEKYF